MSSKPSGCFFLDSCIILPQSMKERIDSTEKFLGNPTYNYYISSSVRKETGYALDNVYNWLQNDIKESFKTFLVHSNIKEITRKDTLLFEPFFEQRRRELGKTSGYYFQVQEQIEHWLAEYVKSIPYGRGISLDIFLDTLSSEIGKIHEGFVSKVEAFEEKEISPSPALRTYLLTHGIRHANDQDHLASTIQYQYKENCWVVFVTFDQNSILWCRKSLSENCALHCSKPDYALERVNDVVSKGQHPLEFFRNIQNPSEDQKVFAKHLKEAGIEFIVGI